MSDEHERICQIDCFRVRGHSGGCCTDCHLNDLCYVHRQEVVPAERESSMRRIAHILGITRTGRNKKVGRKHGNTGRRNPDGAA